jgi:C4-dicarboxylate-specific signal transduction histidine kinase
MDLVPVMTISPREMEQVFYQLIQWVVDAPDGGSGRKLVITCVTSDQHVELVFSDSGGADRMRRSGGSGLADLNGIEGMGLGLAVVEQIVADHQGEIRTEVRPGQEGILRIRLPVTRVY